MHTCASPTFSYPDLFFSFETGFEELPRTAAKAKADLQPRATHHHVRHNYIDRSNEEQRFIDPRYWMKIKESPASPFPIKVYRMLERVENDGLQHIVSWQSHGRCFLIHRPKEFTRVILPTYMSLNKLASFQRQLNLYGFGRITQGLDKGGYYHEFLLRGKGPLALEVQRAKVKGTCVRGKSNPLEEPNFWIMPWLQSSLADNMAIAQNMDIGQQPSLLRPPTNALPDAYKDPSKLECRSIIQSFKDLKLPLHELSSKRRPQKDLIDAETFQVQSTLQRNGLEAVIRFQSPSVPTGMEKIFSSFRAPLTKFTAFTSNLNSLSNSLDNYALGEYYDIEPLSLGASAEDDIFLDNMDLNDMLERVKSL